jgi:flagellar motility protein MotE (MotC chaperone)
MNNYSQHFKKLKNQKQKQKKMSIGYHTNKVKKDNPWMQFLGLLSLIGFCLTLYGVLYPENIEQLTQVKLSFLSQGLATEGEKSTETSVAKTEENALSNKTPPVEVAPKEKSSVENKASHIEQLLEKEKELVEREKRILEMEEKLQQTQSEIDKKLQLLDQTRREIASRLETRVVQDQESIEKLVGVYSNMKPQSAAMVISRLDEELAISVLKKMKKQDAGNILNYMDAQKAKSLSEKYSGY